MMILGTRERKREADELVDVPDAKKPRLIDESTDEADPVSTTNTPTTEDIVMATKTDKDPSTEPASNKEKGKSKLSETGGSFRENPYTFLSPDDPILMSCM
jgi:multisite-specific tRNA:(cytosine-C5)-methyltransferase